MITDIDKYVDFLCKHRLSESQFLILWLVYTKDKNNLNKYIQVKGNFSKHDIHYLIDCKFLDYYNDRDIINGNFNMIDFQVSEKFSKIVIIDEDDAYEELCSVYPKWMEVKGTKWPMIKGDPMKIGKSYYKAIKGNKLAHQRVIDITIKYFKNKPVLSNIEDYVLNRRWNLLEEELDKSGGSQDVFKTL